MEHISVVVVGLAFGYGSGILFFNLVKEGVFSSVKKKIIFLIIIILCLILLYFIFRIILSYLITSIVFYIIGLIDGFNECKVYKKIENFFNNSSPVWILCFLILLGLIILFFILFFGIKFFKWVWYF